MMMTLRRTILRLALGAFFAATTLLLPLQLAPRAHAATGSSDVWAWAQGCAGREVNRLQT